MEHGRPVLRFRVVESLGIIFVTVVGLQALFDEEVKKLVFVDFTVCLLGFRYTFSKQTSQITEFVMD